MLVPVARRNSKQPIAQTCSTKSRDHKSALKNSSGTSAARAAKRKYRDKPLPPEIRMERQLRPQDIPAAKAIVLEQIEDHGSPTRACLAAGVGRRTFYQWLQEKEFRKEYALARRVWRASMVSDVEAAFGERAQYKDTLAGIFVLKHNTKRYREVSRVQLSGPDGGPIVTLDAKEELIKRLERLTQRERPAQVVGGVEVGSVGSQGPGGLRVLKSGSEGSRGPKVRKARGVSYG